MFPKRRKPNLKSLPQITNFTLFNNKFLQKSSCETLRFSLFILAKKTKSKPKLNNV
ncbi:Uncharacterised protein [Chlamydia trachomatis]|nr:Uncharacterised protein [Chlamydia trachomatis]